MIVCFCMCRQVLVNAGFQLSDDDQSVIYVSDCNKFDDDDDADDDDDERVYDYDGSGDVACSDTNTDNRASQDHCVTVIEDDWC